MERKISKRVGFYLQKRSKWKGDKNREHPIVMSFNYQGKRLCTLVGFKVAERDWDNRRQRVRLPVKRSSEMNRYLDKLEEKTNDIYSKRCWTERPSTTGTCLGG